MWVIRIGAGYLLGVRFGLGLTGIWIAMALDENVRAAAFLIRFKRGAWKKSWQKPLRKQRKDTKRAVFDSERVVLGRTFR